MRTEPTFFIKEYGDSKHMKLVYMPWCRMKHIEEKHYVSHETLKKIIAARSRIVNDHKLQNNLSRAKSKVRELVLCNKFEYFVTLTLSPDKIKRTDLKLAITRLNRIVSDMNKTIDGEWGRKERVTYVLIPERHKNGAWHFHGFIHGLTKYDIRKNKNGFPEWRQYADKLGYTNLTEIQNKDRAASYCLKYITKDLARSVTKRGAHLYYASKGLETAKVVYRGTGLYTGEWDYMQKDGYCYVADYDKQEVRDNFHTTIDVEMFPRMYEKAMEKVKENKGGFFASPYVKGGIYCEEMDCGTFSPIHYGYWCDRIPDTITRGGISIECGIWGMVVGDHVQLVWD